MQKKTSEWQPIEPRVFKSQDEIELAIRKLQRRIDELTGLQIAKAVAEETNEISVVRSNIKETIRDVFGTNSPEFKEHQYLDIWAGGMFVDMSDGDVIAAKEAGKVAVLAVLKGLIGRLREKQSDMSVGSRALPSSYFDQLNLHPRIADVARDLFLDGHWWDAVFAGSKALINYIKERSGRHDLDGSALVRTVFSRQNPVLAFNDLANQSEADEQEGMMHFFEGAVLAIRNPGGHTFPNGSEQRAIEYIPLLSFLAYRTQEAKRRPKTEPAPNK